MTKKKFNNGALVLRFSGTNEANESQLFWGKSSNTSTGLTPEQLPVPVSSDSENVCKTSEINYAWNEWKESPRSVQFSSALLVKYFILYSKTTPFHSVSHIQKPSCSQSQLVT